MASRPPGGAPLVAACVCISVMFVLSGIDKLRHSRSCADAAALTAALRKLTGRRHCGLARAGMLAAGALELAAPAALVYGAAAGDDRARRAGAWALLAFTVVVTLVVKVYVKFRYYGFMSNLALCGGLVAVATYPAGC